MTLYELAQDYTAFLIAVENGDIPEEAIPDTLESIEASIDEKVDNTACVIKVLQAEMAAIKAEEERLAKRRKAKETAMNKVKTYLADMILSIGKTEFESPRNKLSFRKSEETVCDSKVLDAKWMRKKETFEPDKVAIKNAILSGEKIHGAEIVVKQNLQIN